MTARRIDMVMRIFMAAMLLAVVLGAPAIALADVPLPAPPVGLPTEVEADPLGYLVLLIQHVQAGSYLLAAAIALALAVAILRAVAVRWTWTQTDRGGAIIAGLCALLGSLAVVLSTGTMPSPSMLIGALVATWAAVGARQWLRRILWPADGGTPWLEWLRDLFNALGKRRSVRAPTEPQT